MFKVFNDVGEVLATFAKLDHAEHKFAGMVGGWIEDIAGTVLAGRKPRGTVDLTPTWSGVLPALLWAYMSGTDTGKRLALEELQRMAKIADSVK